MKEHRSIWRRGFTMIELLIVIGIVLVLASLVGANIPGLLQRAQQARCESNLRNIWSASLSYAADNNGTLAPNQAGNAVFAGAIRPYLDEENMTGLATLQRSVLVCPGDRYPVAQPYFIGGTNTGYALSYAQNGYIGSTNSSAYGVSSRIVSWKNPSRMAALMDYESHYIATPGTWAVGTRLDDLARRHAGKMNVLFADGHLETPFITNMDLAIPNMFWQGR